MQKFVSSQVALALASGCIVLMLCFGVRASLGLFLPLISDANGWGRSVYSQSLAVQNLVWGLGAVLAGWMADRYGNRWVILGGALAYGLGLLITPYAGGVWSLSASMGLLVGLGISGTAFGIVLPAMVRAADEERRQFVLGLGTAAGSAGQFVIVLATGALIGMLGWESALLVLALMAVSIVVFAQPLSPYGTKSEQSGEEQVDQDWKAALVEAFAHPSYRYLVAGFFVCGFNLAFVTVHMPAYLNDQGFTLDLGAQSLAIIGFFNIIGSLASGYFSERYSKRWTLFFIYIGRAVAFSALMLLPLTTATVYIFCVFLGLLWLATIPPTAGMVAHFFGTRYMAMLYGVVFFSHQVGSYIGVWLGAWVYDRSGHYDFVWWLSAVLALLAAIAHVPIREEPVARLSQALPIKP